MVVGRDEDLRYWRLGREVGVSSVGYIAVVGVSDRSGDVRSHSIRIARRASRISSHSVGKSRTPEDWVEVAKDGAVCSISMTEGSKGWIPVARNAEIQFSVVIAFGLTSAYHFKKLCLSTS